MNKLNCNIRVVVYEGNKECPELLELNSQNYSIIPPEVLDPLKILNGQTYSFSFCENATILTLTNSVKIRMSDIQPNYKYWDYLTWAIYYQDRYYLDDYSVNLSFILEKYFGFPKNDCIELQLLISANAGEIDNADGLEYYMYSHEKGSHHWPHVHVNTTDHNHSAVIRIEDGELLDGKLPGKKLKIARERIKDNKRFFCICWNTKTDGIRIDINNHFNMIGY